MKKPKLILIIIVLHLLAVKNISAQATFPCLGTEQVVNGNFNLGNTGFSSSYNYTPPPNTAEGQYYVGTSVGAWNGGMVNSSGDHTTGTGNMLMANGSPTVNASIWCETISVTANTNYVFSAWVVSFNSTGPFAQLQVSINGVNIGTPFNAPTATNIWSQMSLSWNSGLSTTANICIVDLSTSIGANDFGLDDISFKSSTSAKISGLNFVYCTNSSNITIQGTPAGGTFSGSGVSGSTFNPVTAGAGGPYHIIYSYTDASSCASKDTVDVIVQGSFTLSAGPNATVCSGVSTLLTAFGGTNYVWSPTNGLSCVTCQNPMATPGVTTTYYVSAAEDIYKLDGTSKNNAGKTCKTILDQGYSTGNGYYWIDPDGGGLSNAFQTYCDMTTSGGGWTKITPAVSSSIVDSIMGSSAKQMAKCSDASTHYIISPSTSLSWSWTIRQLVPTSGSNSWNVDGTLQPCGSDPEFSTNLGNCNNFNTGLGFGCSDGGGTQNKFYPGEADGGGGCNDSVAHTNKAFSGPCAGTGSAANSHYHFFIRTDDSSPSVVNCSQQGAVTITINTPTLVVTPGSASICVGSNVSIAISGADQYTWSPAGSLSSSTGTTVIATPTITTLYAVNGTSLTSGCSGIKNIKVTVNSFPTIVIAGNNPICPGNSTGLSASGGIHYLWSNGATSSSISVSPVLSSSYTVIVSNVSGCTDSSNVTVTVYPVPTITISNSQTICAGNTAQLSATGGNTYLWNTGDTGNNISVKPFNPSSYSVTGTNMNGCSNTVSSMITPSPVVVTSSNATINRGEAIQLSITTNGTSYNWSPSNSLSCNTCSTTTASPDSTTKYIVTVTDNNNCSRQDTIIVTVIITHDCGDVFIPNAFSPNADTKNDVLYIKTPDATCIQTMSFEIFDRWGNLVFQSTDPSIGWDGKFKGKEFTPAVFVYKFQATLIDGAAINKKGNISLIK